MRINDVLLFIVVFASMGAAVLFPAWGVPFQPYILHMMMLLLFLSFLRMDFRALMDRSASALARLGFLVAIKLLILPSVLYGIVLVVIPEYSIPVLLLSGISTGVVAPFIAGLVGADIAQVLKMVIVSSILAPFSLPALVKLLAGTRMDIPLGTMVQLLAMVVFLPMAGVLVMRRFLPGLPERIATRQFPLSLALFAMINLGVFSKYSSFFFAQPDQLLISLVLAYVLSAIYFAAGYLIISGKKVSRRLAGGVSLAIMNNVLVIVFSSRFFGPLSPLLAAMYMFPFYTLIVPMKMLAERGRRKASSGPEPA